ncbi:DEAD/DEAH box helicase family protein [Mesoplasma florum]|uniref:DEAD/DEAH box helicase family protein n=1 Tax=Mesoplasma florum TaxID=2151 RepID=UPI000BE32C5F|nr:DEAD/DEAH box helicase family protein [Mesoplasma florum]ATI73948.1 hypothetical protein CQZ70_01630 [Mesoplasma florum]
MEKNLLQDLLIKIDEYNEEANLSSVEEKSDIWYLNQLQKKLEKEIASFETQKEKLDYINSFLPEQEKFSQFIKTNEKFQNISNNLSLNKLIVSMRKVIEQEFLSADEVLMISPFISQSMVQKLRNWMIDNKNLKVKIITTTFDGTSRFLSIETLVELCKEFGSRVSVKIENSFKNYGSRIHVKAYCFLREGGFGNLYVGSNNFTKTGIMLGNEYSVKISEFRDKDVFEEYITEFKKLWFRDLIDINDEVKVTELIEIQKNIDKIEKEKSNKENKIVNKILFNSNEIKLYDYQQEVIDILQYRESVNINRHLVVMATGTGKTLTVAKYFEMLFKNFDNKHKFKLLFVAHQKEILDQAVKTFNFVMPGFKNEVLELYDQRFDNKNIPSSNFIFATLQTLSKNKEQLEKEFDLVIFDEVHHIEAEKYKEIFEIVAKKAKSIIGLTATPERTEGIDVNKYFNYEYAYELSLYDALEKDLLSPFEYFFIKDDSVDLTGIDINAQEKLGDLLSSDQRNEFIYQTIVKNIGINNRFTSTVLFCTSKSQAKKLNSYLLSKNISSAVLTSENEKEERIEILKKFKDKEINYLCVRDILNEGVDIPDIDRVMFLRPTNSLIIYLQQLGRGLRKRPDKKLQVYDFVNNVDLFVNKKYDPLILFKAFNREGKTRISELLNKENKIDSFLPEGSEICIDKITLKDLTEKIRKYESNKRTSLIISQYNSEIKYENYESMFIENRFIDNFVPYKIYSKNYTFIQSNVEYANIFKRMSVMNFKCVIEKWIKIISSKKIDLNNNIDKLFISNICNSKMSKKLDWAEKDLIRFWGFILDQKEFIQELNFLLNFKLKNEDNILKEINDVNDLLSYGEMYLNYDQIKVLFGEGIIDNSFSMNSNQNSEYKVKDGQRIISASSLTVSSKFKHANYYFEKTNELIWESPNAWKFDSAEKIDLDKNNYSILYQSHETVKKFDEKIRKYVGNIETILEKISLENPNKNRPNKIRYKFKLKLENKEY